MFVKLALLALFAGLGGGIVGAGTYYLAISWGVPDPIAFVADLIAGALTGVVVGLVASELGD